MKAVRGVDGKLIGRGKGQRANSTRSLIEIRDAPRERDAIYKVFKEKVDGGKQGEHGE